MDPIITAEIKRVLAWFLPSFLGVATKLAFESRLKKITQVRVLTSLIMACFVGYICDKLCTKYDLSDMRGVVVAIGALASESIVQYTLINSNRIFKAIVKRIFNIELKDTPKDEVENDSSN